jgi:dipeptidyl aminopeptidase/acylaminoacyl peptidase
VHTLDIKNGTLTYTAVRDMGLTEIYSYDGSTEKKLTSFNDAILAERTISPVEEFTFSYKDVELDGYVMKPVDFDPNKKYPAILKVHGGPRTTFGPTFFHESALEQDFVIVSGGKRGFQIKCEPKLLASACKGQFADIIFD